MKQELTDVQAGFGKGRGTKNQIANICWIIEKARELQKSIYFCFTDYAKTFDCVDHDILWKILKEMGIPVRECLTGGFLHAVSASPLFLFKQNSMLLPGTGVIVWDRLESPLVNILFTTKLLSLDPLSWHMDCLLTLWPSSSLVPLVTVTVHLVFWSLSLTKETSCTTDYIYSQKNH